MTRLCRLEKCYPEMPSGVLLKADLLFAGLRPNKALVEAAVGAQPHFHTVLFEGKARAIPYFLHIPDMATAEARMFVLIRPCEDSPYHLEHGEKCGELVLWEEQSRVCNAHPSPLPGWFIWAEREGLTRATTAMSQHGDMLVANLAPACEYWSVRDAGESDSRSAPGLNGSFIEDRMHYACRFCGYGAVSERSRHLGQKRGVIPVASEALSEFRRAISHSRKDTKHVFLVGGSLRDRNHEGQRYLELVRACVQAEPAYRGFIGCGSQALTREWSRQIRTAGAGYACYNLEVWDKELWTKICPGKARFVGYEEWLESLVDAVEVFGRGAVFSAMVTGVELVPPDGFPSEKMALESNLQGAEWMLSHGIVPIHSPFSPAPASVYRSATVPRLDYFLRLNFETWRLRAKHNLRIDTRFICSGCTYAQIECDLDRFA
ncbi:MAG: hypothetical protein N2255_05735 [Kiritimatiellae bacterium]|nr:hypothetical protein [Kiritimatiellia bacterium]